MMNEEVYELLKKSIQGAIYHTNMTNYKTSYNGMTLGRISKDGFALEHEDETEKEIMEFLINSYSNNNVKELCLKR